MSLHLEIQLTLLSFNLWMWFSKTFLVATLGPVGSLASCASPCLPEFCSGQLEFSCFSPQDVKVIFFEIHSTRWNLMHRMILMTMVSFQLQRIREDPKIRNDAWSLSTIRVSVSCEKHKVLQLLKSKRQRSCIPRYVYVQGLQLTYTAFQLSCKNSGKPSNNKNSWI